MVGSAIVRLLAQRPNIEIVVMQHKELDLCNQTAVKEFMKSEKLDEVILAAPKKVGYPR